MNTRRRKQKRIAVVTGTRAEYGLLTSTMRAIQAERRLQLQLVVTGMHLLRKFGHTVKLIERDGWPISARVRMQDGSDSPLDQANGLSRGVAGIARFVESAATDVVVVLGDRIEAAAGALAAVTTGRVLAHVHGGDVAPGDFDDSLRHAITKLAHVHFPATRQAARRIVRLGESPQRVHTVGAIGLDQLSALLAEAPPTRERSGEAFIIQHACGRAAATEKRTMQALLRAVASVGLRRLISYPNTDRGHRGVLEAIEQHQRSSPRDEVQVFRSLPRDEYLLALMRADVLVGNSSSGIIEAPLAGTPTVNVGPRQTGRQVGGPSVTHAGESEAAIRKTIEAALRKRPRTGRQTPYGDGRAGQRIARILADLPERDALVRKVIAY